MCSLTHFPEAIPLRKITAPVIIKALMGFFSLFGLPKTIQTDKRVKQRFDQRAVSRSCSPDDKVLVLIPVMGSALQARYSGPYRVERALLEDEGRTPSVEVIEGRMKNSEVFNDLDSFLSSLSTLERNDLISLIKQHENLFPDVPRRTTIIEHDIDVGSTCPIKQHPYRTNPHKRLLFQSEVKFMLKNGIAESTNSPWSSPCLLTSDGSMRFCTDFRRVNAVTKPDSYPLPRIDDCVDRLGSAVFVSKIDLLKGYWQVPLTLRAKEISAFVTPDHFLQYTAMAFGLRNAPDTFQRLSTGFLMVCLIARPIWMIW
ncbi:hypothetical protein PO909_030165 [Leuciscus waleckii]